LGIDASWTYNLPVDRMETQVKLSVRQSGGSTALFDQEYTVASAPGEPASGTLAFDGQVTLPADQTWILHYEMSLFTYAGTRYNYATGNGYVNFQLSPEPAGAALLALGLLALTRRRRL
jgi:MYXO-CTERM domain-containing protein